MKIKPVQKQTRAGQRTRSRPSSSSVTPRDTSVLVSRPPRKSQPPSAPPSSLPSSALSLSEEVTGAPTSESLTLCPPRRAASAVPSLSVSSPRPAVPAWSHRPLSSVSCSLVVSRTSTLPRLVPPRPSRTPSRPPSLPSPTHTLSSHPTYGRRPSLLNHRLRHSQTSCVRVRSTRRFLALWVSFSIPGLRREVMHSGPQLCI
jgi:hypothetical protein